ncbi:hypothetical protein [Algibacter lectus]|uniref:hypothetical protein n=1 Tax=Algibacter lectus TaxID=221126 RepID=UPI00249476A9|nr:hypothetical protein [Algibacter lectus]
MSIKPIIFILIKLTTTIIKTFYRLSVITLLLAIVIFSCEDEKQKSFDQLIEKHIISTDQGVNIFKEFQINRTNILEPILQNRYKDSTFQDTKFVWLSLEDMKEYITYIDAIQDQNPNSDITGL